jgi:hypothetical protein
MRMGRFGPEMPEDEGALLEGDDDTIVTADDGTDAGDDELEEPQ